ncbi:zinc finger protein 646 [Xyrauchen texanus]|uniref:zinc finger protein 646 n=1 Tax=Xyrauchen texanus TaxID=154827 RepID=UPI002241A9C6|nr:zinc finger protein 646 [Xyrauchen texanus]XP_051959005.1 zinc finger protein 646 [Xyrauchen texanus]
MAMQGPGRSKGFSCRHCGVVFASMPSLSEHTDAYHQSEEERKFKCVECGRGYRHAGSLANHKKTHEVGSFQCHICSRKLFNALALKSHLRIHTSRKKYSCNECGKAFRLAAQLTTHQKVHRNKESQGWTRMNDSARINIESGCKDDDLPHLDEVDFDIIPDLQPDMKLNIASMSILSNGAVSEHVPSSNPDSDTAADDDAGDRPFKCNLCDKTYRHHGSLINHKKTHQMGVFECPMCFKQFNNLSALNSHQRIHNKTRGHPIAQTSAITDCKPELTSHVMPQNGDANVHFCHLCQVAFPNDDEFQNHILLHNSSSVSFELPTSLSEEPNFSYNDSVTHSPESTPYPPCSDTPPLPPLLDKPVDYDQSEGPMENGHIYVPNTLDNLTIHAQEQPLQSENLSLDQSAQTVDNVKVEDAGSSERRFKCHICGKSYRHAGSLINHKRSHQTGIFQCSICRKNYPHLAALRSHLRIHKGRPTSLPASAENDWLSSEPLTHENRQGCFPSHEEDASEMLGLPRDLVDSVQHKSDEELLNETNATEIREQFENSFQEERPVHLPQDEPLIERHMCADCGKIFTDIAGIKSHMCPLLNQQYQTIMNGTSGHVDFHNTKHQHFLGESGEHIGFEEHNGSAADYFSEQTFNDNIHGQMSDGDDNSQCEDGDEEDDGEMYQCSVCGNHYASMRALRSHLRGHTQTHATPSASGPSSSSSLEVKRDEPGENQQGECSLIICSTCGESFAKKQDLQSHQLLHSNIEGNPPEKYGSDNPNEIKPKVEVESIICGKCGISCIDLYHLNNHNCTGQRDGCVEEKCEEKPDLGHTFQQELGLLQESPHDGERQYRCDQCGRVYRHAGSLLNHKKSHKTGVFRCFVCQKRFYNLLALKNHQRTHFDVKKHTCTECGKAFKIHKQLLNHQRVHQENKAKIEELNKQIQTLMQMSGNASGIGMLAHNSGRKRFGRRRKHRQASSCDQSSQEKEGLMGDPSDPRPFVCDQCGRSYRHAGSLVNHKNSHKTGEYYCALCNNTYSNQLAMKNHLRIHFAIKRHRCQDCGRAFRGNKQLLNHTCSTNKRTAAARRKLRGRKQAKDLRCIRCRLVFPDSELLAGHTCSKETGPDSDHPGNADADNDSATLKKEERPFKCNICSRSYRHAGSLLNHKNTHKTGHFTCSFCAKPFSNPMALRNHTRIHTQRKKYVCPTCGKAFRLSSILYNHQKIHARAVSHYSCQTCGKSFQGRSGLKRHRCYRNGNPSSTISQDGVDKCYMCDQCGRSYRHAGSLLNHKKTHSANLLNCTLCLKTFTDPLELECHSQMARHCCPDCGKTFCEFTHLQSHMEVHSKGLPYYCNLCQQNFPNLASFQQHQELHGSLQGQSHHQQGMQMHHDLGWDSALDQQIGIQSLPKIESAFGRVHGFPEPQDQHESSEEYGREEKSHVCEHCGRTYRHAGSLLNHKNSHKTGSFFCSVCQKEFTNLMALKNHRRIHTEPKRYQCLECGKAFRVSTQLICHRRIHTKEKPFSCLLCDKRFSSKSNLRHHQKMHQNTQQTYESSDMDANEFMGLGVDPFL